MTEALFFKIAVVVWITFLSLASKTAYREEGATGMGQALAVFGLIGSLLYFLLLLIVGLVVTETTMETYSESRVIEINPVIAKYAGRPPLTIGSEEGEIVFEFVSNDGVVFSVPFKNTKVLKSDTDNIKITFEQEMKQIRKFMTIPPKYNRFPSVSKKSNYVLYIPEDLKLPFSLDEMVKVVGANN